MTLRQATLLLYPISSLFTLACAIYLFLRYDFLVLFGWLIAVSLVNLALAPRFLRSQWMK
jgi:hypothetical protein